MNENATIIPHGGKVLVDALEVQGVQRVFCIPGESYLAALDGLFDSGIETIVARQEGGAALMAEAHGKLTGTPGIAFVTRGPGATNASAGVHVAFQDSTPMILFIGQVASDQKDREAFQEVDYRAMFGPLAKWVAEVERVDRLPEYVSRAFHVAQSGRPGPVVLALPEDMLSNPCTTAALPQAVLPSGAASTSDIDAILYELERAERPFILAGGSGWSSAAAEALADLAKAVHAPVGTSFRCQDFIDNRHPTYAGDVAIGINPRLAERIKTSDLVLCLGPRLGEMTTGGYTLLTPPKAKQRLIHVHADPSEIGRVYHPDLSVAASASAVVRQLAGAVRAMRADRAAYVAEARAEYEAWQRPIETPGALKMEAVIQYLSATMPDNMIIANGAGNYATWVHRYYCFRRYRTQLAPTSGSMGYGLPAAIAAKLHAPEREVICVAGDGCLQMVVQEFGTACQYGASVIVLVANNGFYGTIRMHQQRKFAGRPSGTALKNPDFAALAHAYGGFGQRVDRTEAFPAALAAARVSKQPAILDLQMSPDALSPALISSE